MTSPILTQRPVCNCPWFQGAALVALGFVEHDKHGGECPLRDVLQTEEHMATCARACGLSLEYERGAIWTTVGEDLYLELDAERKTYVIDGGRKYGEWMPPSIHDVHALSRLATLLDANGWGVRQ